jgi:catechol 2,3-dioxygenase-like lactoylglutathione lyase family enzyme
MWTSLRMKLIGWGFKARVRSLRARRVLGALGRPRLRGVDHLTIAVTDLDVARQFYCDVLGGVLLMVVDDALRARFGQPPAPDGGEGSHHISVNLGGATRVDLFLQHAGQPAPALGHPHYAFEVPPRDMLRWRRRLVARGVPIEGPLRLGPPGQASIYFNDPFGNRLEITCLGFVGAVEQRPPVPTRLTWAR